jgi:hypothetical protein
MENRSSIKMAVVVLLLAVVSALGGCHEANYVLDPGLNDEIGPFGLTFSLDSSFQATHGGQPIRIAVVRGDVVVAQTSGTVSATQDPPFSFTADAVLMRGITHEVRVWIDSNLGGGTLGVCDPEAIDHQWSTEFPWPTNDVDFTLKYQTWLMEDVCDTFD